MLVEAAAGHFIIHARSRIESINQIFNDDLAVLRPLFDYCPVGSTIMWEQRPLHGVVMGGKSGCSHR